MTLFNNFFSSVSVFDSRSQQYHDACVCKTVHSSACKQTAVHPSSTSERRLLHQYKKLLNKVIFVFFAHKKYSRSFIKLRLNTDVAWTILTMSLLRFWALNMVVALLSMQGQKALGFHQKYLNLCFENERRSNWFGTTWRWVINDRIKIFGLTIPLTLLAKCCFQPLQSSSKFTM